MSARDRRAAWALVQTLASEGWVTGTTTPSPSGERVVLEVLYAADPPDTAPCHVVGADATDAARMFLTQFTDAQP